MDKPRWYVSWVIGGLGVEMLDTLHLNLWQTVLNSVVFAGVALGVERYRSHLQNKR